MVWLSDGSELSSNDDGNNLFQDWLESELDENYIPPSMESVFAKRPDVESDPQTWILSTIRWKEMSRVNCFTPSTSA